MGYESFDRLAVLKVFENKVEHKEGTNEGALSIIDTNPDGKAYPSRQKDGSPGYRIRFSIDKLMEATSNYTSIYIYNLGPDNRAVFEKTYSTIVVEGGYGETSDVLYRGNIARCRTRKEGSDYITHIEAADGLFASQYARVDQAWRPGAKKNEIINTLTDALKNSGLKVGEVRGLPTDGYNQGLVLSGKTMEKLRELCSRENLTCTVQDGEITIYPLSEASDDLPVLVSPNTGMIGIPEKKDVGIAFKVLMNPKLKIGRKVTVQSKFVNGTYRVAKVTHTGDSFGGDWFTLVEAV